MDRPDGSPTAVDVVTRAEWAVKEGTDIALTVGFTVKAAHTQTSAFRDVTVGKTYYITSLSFRSQADAAADSDLNQICYAIILDSTAGTNLWVQGGNGGGSQSMARPVPVPSGHRVFIIVGNSSNHDCELFAGIAGYEV